MFHGHRRKLEPIIESFSLNLKFSSEQQICKVVQRPHLSIMEFWRMTEGKYLFAAKHKKKFSHEWKGKCVIINFNLSNLANKDEKFS